jgi:CheY-like chemotaxis protein
MKVMVKVMFVDDEPDVINRQWCCSGCANNHELIPLEPFVSIEQTCQIVKALKPDVIFMDYDLGQGTLTVNGALVIRALRQLGYKGLIVANTGGNVENFRRYQVDVDGSVGKGSANLSAFLKTLSYRKLQGDE